MGFSGANSGDGYVVVHRSASVRQRSRHAGKCGCGESCSLRFHLINRELSNGQIKPKTKLSGSCCSKPRDCAVSGKEAMLTSCKACKEPCRVRVATTHSMLENIGLAIDEPALCKVTEQDLVRRPGRAAQVPNRQPVDNCIRNLPSLILVSDSAVPRMREPRRRRQFGVV